MLREEVEQYTNLAGEDGWHVPIMRVGAYLDGYNKGLEVLDKIRAEITEKENKLGFACASDVALKTAYIEVLQIIDKYTNESEGCFSDYPDMPYQFDNMTGSMNL